MLALPRIIEVITQGQQIKRLRGFGAVGRAAIIANCLLESTRKVGDDPEPGPRVCRDVDLIVEHEDRLLGEQTLQEVLALLLQVLWLRCALQKASNGFLDFLLGLFLNRAGDPFHI